MNGSKGKKMTGAVIWSGASNRPRGLTSAALQQHPWREGGPPPLGVTRLRDRQVTGREAPAPFAHARERHLDDQALRPEADQVAGSAAPSTSSRSAVNFLPLVSGPRSTAITTTTRKSIVLIIIGMAKPIFICTAM